MDEVVRTVALTKMYGETIGLDALDLSVPRGVVFGYLGPNGAGKTTTIRLLLGLLRATAGHAEVMGLDAWRDRDRVHTRVGYLPGDFAAYPDLTGREYVDYLGHLRGGTDSDNAALLAKRFDLDLDRRIGTLSHGNRQKVGVIQAFVHGPDLVVLDEPTSGLDPLMQREFLALVRETRDAGHTVFLSSHELDEVEAVADMVAILRAGKLVVVETMDVLKTRARHQIEITFAMGPAPAVLEQAEGVQEVTMIGPTAEIAVEGSMRDLLDVAVPYGIERIESREADLEEIFLSYYRKE